jgi:hypothetical protein
MLAETMNLVIQALNKDEVMDEESAKTLIKDLLTTTVAQGVNFSYYGYFVYNRSHPKKWLEFDVHAKLHPEIWRRTSCVSNNYDPDVVLARKVTDEIMDKTKEFYMNREQTRIIIDFNSDLENGELKISISE